MSRTVHPIRKNAYEVLLYFAVLLLLVLTSINIGRFISSRKVLGAETASNKVNQEKGFWEKFLSQHPNYIPGWNEIGRQDKVGEIDPNFFIQASVTP